MGRDGSGVEIREESIRVGFAFNGKFQRHTLKVNGRALPPTQANLKYARRIAKEIRDRIREGTFSLAEYFPAAGDGPGPLTVGAQLDAWLGTQKITDSTRAGYQSAIRFWKARIGARPLRGLKLSEVLTALNSHPMSGKTARNYLSPLREALELAVTDHLIDENPAAKVKRPKHQQEPPDPFTPEERDRIIAEAERRFPGQVANLIAFWFWAGPRTSEAFGLRWPAVDLPGRYVRIREALVRGKRKGTKTDVVRDVRLNSIALTALQRQRAHTQLAGEDVFQDPRYGQGWSDERAFRRSFWTPILKALGIRYRRPYNMRHTYATAMLMAGMTPAYCATQLGHSVEVFLRTYARWIHTDRDDLEMARLERSISGIAQELPKNDGSAPK